MKSNALYHLLMARARSLAHGADATEQAFVDALRESLRIDLSGGWYELVWRWRDKDYTVSVPDGTFRFYVRGDTGRPRASEDLRGANRREADALLRRLADLAGARLPRNVGEAGRDGSNHNDGSSPVALHMILALPIAVGLGALALLDAIAGLWSALAALLCLALVHFQRGSHLRLNVHPVQAGIVAAGALLPAALGTQPIFSVLLAFFLVAMCVVETRGAAASPMEWAVAGALAGPPIYWAGAWALIGAALAILVVACARAVMPVRVRRGHAWAFGLAAAVAALGAAFASPALVDAGAPGVATLGVPTLVVAWMGVALALFCALTWWIFGVQFVIFPWHAFVSIALVGAFALSLSDRAHDVVAMTAFTGLLVFASERVIRSMLRSRTDRMIKGAG